ncbi:MAG TPA: UDP-N-acetylglucosamine 2-epimerase (non-hydrolyzing) [Cryptosporangiaceae bacterium]|nr:UDP-N-acetylglucosamine 2-epimerase (non-hydrolyzing) [Cryptosporangiaceae bacterium]
MTAAREIAVVLGTRPEAIKLAPVVAGLRDSGWARPHVVVTGQHDRSVIDDVLRLFGLQVDVDLAVPRGENSVAALTAAVLRSVDAALATLRPDLVMVQGDTATTLSGALAGFFRRIPVAHLEAGLRTYDLAAPFPEEGNRRLVTGIAALHLAPTVAAAANLFREGAPAGSVVLTGNTVLDALRTASALRRPYGDPALEALDASGRRVVVVTAHRRESWGEPMRRVGAAVARLARLHPEVGLVLAAHMNPAVRDVLEAEVRHCPNVLMPGPMAYGPFARLLARADLVVTDSGGIQEEAPSLGVPVLVTRDVTEREESVEAGVARLVGTDPATIVAAAHDLLTDPVGYGRMAQAVSPYGDGRAAHRCVEACGWLLGVAERPHDFAPHPVG